MGIRSRTFLLGILFFSLPFTAQTGETHSSPPPEPLDGLEYSKEYFPDAHYDPSVPTPDSLLGFPVGRRTASPEQIEICLRAWEESSPRTRLFEYARTHEGRPLYYMIVSSPVNLNKLDEIQAGYGRLADPRGLSQQEGKRLLESLPAVAWFAYSIHGNETSGADAALAVLYHLTASTDPEVSALLDEIIVIIDPMMNPDGRARFIKQLAEHGGTSPNVDDQSLLHSGYWPWGRTNHYLFDLNRDWILGVHPETRGRIRAAAAWHPLLFIDGHEMGSQDTFLFSPPRDPVNRNFPAKQEHWLEVFARDHAASFDRFFWPYYTGEWNDGWYPGYSNSWAGYRGAVGILYEQARIAHGAVRRPAGNLLTYKEAVHHQIVATLTNLRTLKENAREILRDFLEGHRLAVDEKGPFANRTFAILPSANRSRVRNFIDLMKLQGFELYTAQKEFSAANAIDQLGQVARRRKLPAGTILIPNRQPEAYLLSTMLEFDPRIPAKTLQRERKEILRHGRSRLYDVTAWNLTMMHGLDAVTLATGLPEGAVPLESLPEETAGPPPGNGAAIGYVIDGADDLSVAAAGRLTGRGVQVRVANQAFLFDLTAYSRGSLIVTHADNLLFEGDLRGAVERTAGELGLQVRPIRGGFGEGDLADIGGEHFARVEPPRIALLTRGGISPYDFGSIWFLLDQRLGLRHSHIDENALSRTDLRRYNVLVVPDRFAGDFDTDTRAAIRTWVEGGGTLIAIGDSAGALASEEEGLSQVRRLSDVLDRLDEYKLAVLREIIGSSGEIPSEEAIWSHLLPADVDLPWEGGNAKPGASEEETSDVAELKKRDEWESLFMPQGAILAGRVDREHWLTFGTGRKVPILFGDSPVLMSKPPVETPIRFGYLTREEAGSKPGDTLSAGTGWAALPDRFRIYLRMSGLVWPEAAHRLANAAYVTREPVGKGQIILFASPPFFRGSTLGTARILMNAMVYGPGLGTDQPIKP